MRQHIINIQKVYKGHKYRQAFRINLKIIQKYNKPNILNKIIFIQQFWKNYLIN